jgi:hypothetical protein
MCPAADYVLLSGVKLSKLDEKIRGLIALRVFLAQFFGLLYQYLQ